MTHDHEVEGDNLRDRPRRIKRLGLETMTILNINRVLEIARRVNRSFQPWPLRHLVLHPPRKGTIIRLEHESQNLREVFHTQKLTPRALRVVRTIQASAS